MAEDIRIMINRIGFDITDEELLKKMMADPGVNSLTYILNKGKREKLAAEKTAMIAIFNKLRSLRHNLETYQKNHPDEASKVEPLLARLAETVNKFSVYYNFVELLGDEKDQNKKYQEVYSKVKYVFESDDTPDEDLRKKQLRTKLNDMGLTDAFCVVNRNLQYARSSRMVEEKSIEEALKLIGINDYMPLLDNEIEDFLQLADSLALPRELQDLVTNWSNRMDEVITQEVRKVYLRQNALEKLCVANGLEIRRKDSGKYIASMLKLYNPNIKVNYDMFDKIYLSSLENMVLPLDATFDPQNNTLTMTVDNEEVTCRLGEQYTRQSFIKKIKELNPNAHIYIDASDTLSSTLSLESLVLPDGFYIDNDPVSKKMVISNKGIFKNFSLTFEYKRRMLVSSVNYEDPEIGLEPIKEAPKGEKEITTISDLIRELQNLNGEEKVTYYNGLVVTNIADPDDFKLPNGFYFDDNLNITNASSHNKDAALSIPVKKFAKSLDELPEQEKVSKPKPQDFTEGKKKVTHVVAAKTAKRLYRRIVGSCLKLPFSLSKHLKHNDYQSFAVSALNTAVNIMHSGKEALPDDMRQEILTCEKQLQEKLKTMEVKKPTPEPEKIDLLDIDVLDDPFETNELLYPELEGTRRV